MKELADRIAALEGQVFFLQGVVACTLNVMSPKDRAAALDAIARRGRPTGQGAMAYAGALALLGREAPR
jgi:hypothetical protein